MLRELNLEEEVEISGGSSVDYYTDMGNSGVGMGGPTNAGGEVVNAINGIIEIFNPRP